LNLDRLLPRPSLIACEIIQAKPQDLEDLVQLGKSFKTCPYYGARAATHSAELVVLPYQMILHKQTRESLGIDLRGNVVVFDEAHNLIDTVTSIHSVEISGTKLLQAHAQLSQYLQRYQDRLKPKNKAYIQQILFFTKSIINYIAPGSETSSASGQEPSGAERDEVEAKIISQNDFLFESGIDNINLFKMEKFFRKSEIVTKVNGFCQTFQVEIKINKDKTISEKVDAEEFERHRPALGLVESFAMSLTNRSADGRILVTKAAPGSAGGLKQSAIKFILLNPEYYFEDILTQARAVIMAGGTMQPVRHSRDRHPPPPVSGQG
jgi:chromosome transmission fidelity protein 1